MSQSFKNLGRFPTIFTAKVITSEILGVFAKNWCLLAACQEFFFHDINVILAFLACSLGPEIN